MSDRKYSQWLEAVAAIGVILSLIFVGLEIRQNTSVARGQARQELAALNQEWLALMGQDAEFFDLWHRAYGPDDHETTDSDARRAWFIMTMHMRRLENVFIQYREGLVGESALRSYGFASVNAFQGPKFEKYWVTDDARAGFDPEFVEYIDTIRR